MTKNVLRSRFNGKVIFHFSFNIDMVSVFPKVHILLFREKRLKVGTFERYGSAP